MGSLEAWRGKADQGDETIRLCLVLRKEGIGGTNRFPPALPFFTGQDFGVCREGVTPDLDGNLRVMHQVDVPVGMLRSRPAFEATTSRRSPWGMHHRGRMRPPALGTCGRDDEHWAAWQRLLHTHQRRGTR